eukprot:CAMPEP_0205801476 /NCGR_PEP_ID=MMETSP0205-20121125/3475_1 /ASSEMBLY_ACC=CAM_ASM_000278 /TAXON_ID=36767 /ORGANISM="Euplotes focardii, Strain TN1" /LENGTH=98 /DNA_ID=CAMNT_0053066283 /DNA_START=191 /DNA_END=485 /DNA_ORIENTATION=-
MTALSDGGYFSRFEWKPESYDDYLEKKKKTEIINKLAVEVVHGKKKFVAGANNAPLKHEPQFGTNKSEEKIIYSEVAPFFAENDPYEATIEEVLKNKW